MTYLASSQSTAVLLIVRKDGGVASASAHVAQVHTGQPALQYISATLSGRLRDSHLTLHTSSRRSASITLTGTLENHDLAATMTLQGTASAIRLRFTRSTGATWRAALARLAKEAAAGSRAGAQTAAIRSDVARLSSEFTLMGREARALAIDTSALESSANTEHAAVAKALEDATEVDGLALARPPTPRLVVCGAEARLRGDVKYVADDSLFVAGFISGLVGSESHVEGTSADVRALAIRTRRAMSSHSIWLPVRLPSKSALSAALRSVSDALNAADASSKAVVSEVEAGLTSVYERANSAILTSGCGRPLQRPDPFGTSTPA